MELMVRFSLEGGRLINEDVNRSEKEETVGL